MFQRDLIINVDTSLCKVTVTIVTFYYYFNFLDGFQESQKYQLKNPLLATEFVECGQTDKEN